MRLTTGRYFLLVWMLLTFMKRSYAQTDQVLGNWVLVEHLHQWYGDYNRKDSNLFHGQLYRSIQFNPNGTLTVFTDHHVVNGTWKIDSEKYGFSMDVWEDPFINGSQWMDGLPFHNGKLNLSESIFPLYNYKTTKSPYRYGNSHRSTYIRDVDTMHYRIDTLKASELYREGMRMLKSHPDDASVTNIFIEANRYRPCYYSKAYFSIAHFMPKENKDAIRYLDVMLLLDPYNIDGLRERAKRNASIGNLSQAMDDINLILLVDPRQEDLFSMREQVFIQLGEKAKEFRNENVSLEDTLKAAALYNKAKRLLDTSITKYVLYEGPIWNRQVINLYKKAGKYRPRYYWESYFAEAFSYIEPRSFYWDGNYYRRKNDQIKWLDTAIFLAPYNAFLYEQRAATKSYDNDNDVLGDKNMQLLLDSNKRWVYQYRVDVLIKLGLYIEALRDLDKIDELDTNRNAYRYYERGVCLYEMGEKEKACEEFTRAINAGYYSHPDRYLKLCGIKTKYDEQEE
jgi:tetratricopeptide (TPR) repeat protein